MRIPSSRGDDVSRTAAAHKSRRGENESHAGGLRRAGSHHARSEIAIASTVDRVPEKQEIWSGGSQIRIRG